MNATRHCVRLLAITAIVIPAAEAAAQAAFNPAVSYAVGTNPAGVALADLDRDGWIDLAVTTGSSRSTSTGTATWIWS